MKFQRMLVALTMGLLLAAPVWAQSYGYGPGMMGWEGSWGLFGLMHILWWVFLIFGIVVLVRWTSGSGPRHPHHASEDRALAILRERYARGEINKAEFEERKQDLKG